MNYKRSLPSDKQIAKAVLPFLKDNSGKFSYKRVIAFVLVFAVLGVLAYFLAPSGSPSDSSERTKDFGRYVDLGGLFTSKEAALAALDRLSITNKLDPENGYSAKSFGSSWKDLDKNGCNARQDAILSQTSGSSVKDKCTPSGGKFLDPYSGTLYDVDEVDFSKFDVDHVVARKDAWVKGAQALSQEQRVEFYNDPLNLVVVSASINRSMQDKDASESIPPYSPCNYASRQISVKTKYNLSVTPAEVSALRSAITQTCK